MPCQYIISTVQTCFCFAAATHCVSIQNLDNILLIIKSHARSIDTYIMRCQCLFTSICLVMVYGPPFVTKVIYIYETKFGNMVYCLCKSWTTDSLTCTGPASGGLPSWTTSLGPTGHRAYWKHTFVKLPLR